MRNWADAKVSRTTPAAFAATLPASELVTWAS